MWGTLAALLLLVSTIQSQSNNTTPSYDEQIANKLNTIESTKTSISTSYNTELPAIQNTQTAVTSLTNNLPNAVVTEKLSAAFAVIEAMSFAFKGTNEAVCFQNFATTKTTAAEQARLTFTSCTSTITASTSQLMTSINNNLGNLVTVANTAKTNVQACGTNKLFRLSNVLFNYCLTAATTTYDTLLASLVTAVSDLQVKRKSNINEVAVCVGRAVLRSQSLMDNFNNYIKFCISTSPMAAELAVLITSVQSNNQTDYAAQVTDVTATSANLTAALAESQASFTTATDAVNAANSAKSQTAAAAKAALEAEYNNTAAAFTSAGNAFASNTLATICVNNIRLALQKNIATQSTNIFTCVQGIRSNTLANDLVQLQTLFNQRQIKEGLTAIQCFGQVDNLFIIQGITKCREDVEADDATNLLSLSYKAMTLKEEAALISTAAERCNTIARRYATRQINKDKLSFETCILRNTQQIYSIPL